MLSNPLIEKQKKFFRYLVYLWIILFWAQLDEGTTAFIQKAKIPLALSVAAFMGSLINLAIKTNKHDKRIILNYCMILLVLAIFPLLTDLSNHYYLVTSNQPHYKTYIKILFISFASYCLIETNKDKNELAIAHVLGISLLGITFIYHYYFLMERRYDGRPEFSLNLGDANFLNTIFSAILPLTILSSQSKHRAIKAFYIILSFFFTFLIWLCASRMGIITLFLTIPTYLYATRIKNRVRFTKIKILAAVGLTSILVGVSLLNRENIVERFLHINDESNMARLQSLKAGLQIFLENPIWGKGPNYIERNFAEIVGYKRLYSETIRITVHNMQVGTLAKYGLSGFTAISLYLYFIFDSIVTKNKGSIDSQSKAYIVGLLIILLNALTLPVDINDWFLVMLSLYVTLGKPCKA